MTHTILREKSCHMTKNMMKWTYHYCHVTIDMVQWILSHDNERELNDGRRTSHSAQRAWLESVQRQTPRKKFLLCSQVEARANLPDIGNKVVGTDKRTSTEEDRGCVRVANIFSAATRSTPIDWNPLSAERYQLLLHAHFSRFVNRIATCWQVGYEVAGRSYHNEQIIL